MARITAGRCSLLALILIAIAAAPMRASAASPPADCEPLGPLPVDHTLPLSPGSCAGVRPGAQVETPLGYCTFNFLFNGSDGHRYIGTAGHCILPRTGEKRWARGSGPWAKDANGRVIGEFAYAVLKDPKDFALIRVARGVRADPSMCYFGGPTGMFTARRGRHVIHYFGNGLALGETLPARSAVATNVSKPDHVYAYGAAIFGDSGAGAIDSHGRAVGVVVTTGIHYDGVFDTGTVGISRLPPQEARAERVLGTRLSLRTTRVA